MRFKPRAGRLPWPAIIPCGTRRRHGGERKAIPGRECGTDCTGPRQLFPPEPHIAGAGTVGRLADSAPRRGAHGIGPNYGKRSVSAIIGPRARLLKPPRPDAGARPTPGGRRGGTALADGKDRTRHTPNPVRSLFLQISVLIGVLTMANRLSGDGIVTEAGLAALGSATAMYMVLAVGDLVVQRAFEYFSPAKNLAEETVDSAVDAKTASRSAEAPSALAA